MAVTGDTREPEESRLYDEVPCTLGVCVPPSTATARSDESTLTEDSDNDGIVDFDEVMRFKTDPHKKDTDDDGIPDKIEIQSYIFNKDGEYVSIVEGRHEIVIFESGGRARPEINPDTDGGGLKDGDEDLNANGILDDGETDPFNPSDDLVKDIAVPIIRFATLDVHTTIPDAIIHITVDATDNVGVTSVTADGASLAETGSIWECDITAPSTTGDYALTIRAEDAAENYAETTVDYSVVNPSGSIGMGVDPRLTTVSAGATAIINIKLVSTENFDDIAHIYLTTEGTYPGYQADLAWFNWTSIEVGVPAGAEVNVPLEVNIPGGESGYKMFYAKLESTKWTPTAMDTGILYII